MDTTDASAGLESAVGFHQWSRRAEVVHHHEAGAAQAVNTLVRTHKTLTGTTPRHAREELRRAWRAILGLAVDEAFAVIASIEPCLADLPQPAAAQLAAEILILRAAGFALTDHSSAALALLIRAQRGRLGFRLRRLAATVGRFCYWKAGEPEKFHADRGRPASASRRLDAAAAFDLSIEAATEFHQLKLAAAKRLAGDALNAAREYSGEGSTAGAFARALLGQIAYEEGHLDAADDALREPLPMSIARSPIECLVRVVPVRARVAMYRGQSGEAVRHLIDGAKLGAARHSPRLMAACLTELVGVYVDMGTLDHARTSFERLSAVQRQHRDACGRRSLIDMHCAFAHARLQLAAAPSREAAAALRQLHQDALDWRDYHMAVGVAVRLAGALQLVGEPDDANAILARALRIAVNTGIFQSLLDGGSAVHGLLVAMHLEARAEHRDVMPFLGTLVRRLPLRSVPQYAAQSPAAAKRVLSPRECHILKLIGGGLSNKRIARELQIAPETVKSHAKHIFVKLNAQTRAEAVARAVGLRLL